MSNLAAHWSETAPVADTYERIILAALCRRADDDGTGAWPAVKTMSRMALCDERTVQRRLAAMRKRGVIALGDQRLVQHLPKGQRPTVYDVLIPRSWYSDAQWEEAMAVRVRSGRPPIDPTLRPDIASPASQGRAKRADTGKSNPKRSRKKKQVSNEGLNGQLFGLDQGNVDNSPSGDDRHVAADSKTSTETGVSAAQAVKTEEGGVSQSPLMRGDSQTPGGCLTDTEGVSLSHPNPSLNPSLNPSSSSGTSTAAEQVPEVQADDEEDEETPAEAQALLSEYARFGRGRFLQPSARAECERLVAERLAGGWAAERLGGYVREWSAQAKNPSTYLPLQLGELPVSPPQPRWARPADKPSASTAPAASEQARQDALAAFQASEAAKAKRPDRVSGAERRTRQCATDEPRGGDGFADFLAWADQQAQKGA